MIIIAIHSLTSHLVNTVIKHNIVYLGIEFPKANCNIYLILPRSLYSYILTLL